MIDYEDGGRETVAYFLVIIVTLGFIGPTVPTGPNDSVINPFSCKTIEGVVVDKEYDEDGHKLYVELYVSNRWDGHIVYVSKEVYNEYQIGVTYEQKVCDLIEYDNIVQTYEDLIDMGFFLPTTP